jgi:hypothetical protein
MDMVKDLAEIVKSFLEIILKGSEVNAKFLENGQTSVKTPINIFTIRPSLTDDVNKRIRKLHRSIIASRKFSIALAVLLTLATSIFMDSNILMKLGIIIPGLLTLSIPIGLLFSMSTDNVESPRATLICSADCYSDFFRVILASLDCAGWKIANLSREDGRIQVSRGNSYLSSPYRMELQLSELSDNSYRLCVEGFNSGKNEHTADIYMNQKNVWKFLAKVQDFSSNSPNEKFSREELS